MPLFTGRAAELAWLDSPLPGHPSPSACASPAAATEGTWEAMRLVLITGMGGVGKTALVALGPEAR